MCADDLLASSPLRILWWIQGPDVLGDDTARQRAKDRQRPLESVKHLQVV
jgi:hypothetical protein